MKHKALIALIAILIIASFFRLWKLDSIPPGIYPDEAINANEGIQAAQDNNFKIFYPENNGREGLFINLLGLSTSIFGINVPAIKIIPALLGILTIIGMFLVTKELFKEIKAESSKPIALFASFFTAVSFWHVNFSRIDFRAIFVPLILTFSFYFLFKGFRKKKPRDLAIGGLIFGIGFHTYISFRLAVILLIFTLLLWLIKYIKQKEIKKFFIFSLLFLICTCIAALPIGFYFLENPENFVSRATGVSVFSQENYIKSFAGSLIAHLGMYNFYGDQNLRHNFQTDPSFPLKSPVLYWPIGLLFLLGLVISLRGLFKKDQRLIYLTLLSWWLIMMLPGALTYEGIPHSLRCIGSIPPTFIFAGLGLNYIYQKRKNKFCVIVLTLVLVVITWQQYTRYFVTWAQDPHTEGAFNRRYSEIGYHLNSLSEDFDKYVIVNEPGVLVPLEEGLPMPAQTIMFIERIKYGVPKATYLLPKDINQIKINKETIIVSMKTEEGVTNEIKTLFPQVKVLSTTEYTIYYINK